MPVTRSNDDDKADLDALREMDYIEYVHGMEAGNMIPFDQFKKMATKLAIKRGYARPKLNFDHFRSRKKIIPEPAIQAAPVPETKVEEARSF